MSKGKRVAPPDATSKECTRCLTVKPIEGFIRTSRTLSGYASICRECHREMYREYRNKTPGIHNKEAARARASYWASPEKRKPRKYTWRDAVKKAAQRAVRTAVLNGVIAKASHCQDCGAVGSLHGHHADYSKPLVVEWLCPPCHGLRHRKYQEPLALQKGEHPNADE